MTWITQALQEGRLRSASDLEIPGRAIARHGSMATHRHEMTGSLREIIERHGAEPKREVGPEMQRRNDLAHRKLCDVGQCMREQAERGRTGPGFLERDVLQIVAHELADPRAAVDMRN